MNKLENNRSFSGIYPHLAVTNDGRFESGIGAVVPWAGNLWFVTYTAHAPAGSQDKLYRLDASGICQAMPQSVGGTHANRMIHTESGQLSIGPYLIDDKGVVRALPLKDLPGRYTATLRHLRDPQNKIYLFGMEGELYEVDVHTLQWKCLFKQHPVVGTHAKGGYTADGRITVTNNGETGWQGRNKDEHACDAPTGVLAEWDGANWRVIQRRQHTEVMGPGGLTGQSAEGDPLWTLGWDQKSVLLNIRQHGQWRTLRLPKGSYTHDGGHGWYTEWPRIRQLEGTGQWLMTMHGLLWEFPPQLTAQRRAGLRPIANFHKMIVDFCRWEGKLVLACNDASTFDNPLLGRCQSNLWWTSLQELEQMGAPSGWGGVWLNEAVATDGLSEPFFIGGFEKRTLHIRCDGPAEFELQVDHGDGNWSARGRFTVSDGYSARVHNGADWGQWARLRCIGPAAGVTAYWHLANTRDPDYYRRHQPAFQALPPASAGAAVAEGIVRPEAGPEMTLQYIAYGQAGDPSQRRQYRIDGEMNVKPMEDPAALDHFEKTLSGRVEQPDFEVDDASVIVRENGQVYRLPRGDGAYDRAWAAGHPRGRREVVTERSLWNIRGTFYELPRLSAGGIPRIRPICTHNRLITDYCSWRGMLVLAGHDSRVRADDHFVQDAERQAGLWFGTVDDLWKLGKPRGQGGPWNRTVVQADEPSDPYLMTGYDRKSVKLSHNCPTEATFTIEIDFLGDGSWSVFRKVAVPPGEDREFAFPQGFMAHWVRTRISHSGTATAWFTFG